MIETAQTMGGGEQNKPKDVHRENEKIFKMRRNDRMAGTVPSWETRKTAKDEVQTTLARAAQGPDKTFEAALSYAEQGRPGDAQPEEFGFADLIDMVNPLQHIPVVNFVYREVTGDEIHPASKIIGGAVYGGAGGAIGAVADTVVEYETGKDIMGNAMSFVQGGEAPEYRSSSDHPETRLNKAARTASEGTVAAVDLPDNVLGFVDLGYGKREVTERVAVAGGRTAGSTTRTYVEVAPPEPAREPITQVTLSPMPRREYN